MSAFSSRILPTTTGALALLAATAIAVEPPKIDALTPAGVRQGESVTVGLIGTPGDQPLEVWCSRAELTAQATEDAGQIELSAAEDAPSGVYWIRIHNAAGASTLRPFLVGTLPEVTEVEPNDAASSAQTVDAAGAVVNGILSETADVDMFVVPLTAGQTLVASLDADRTLGSPMDGVLQVVSPQGFVVQQNDDDHGIDPQIAFIAPADGAYAVRLFAFPKQPNSSIQFSSGNTYVYRLTLTAGPFVDRVVPLSNDPIGPFRAAGWNIVEPLQFAPLRDGQTLKAALPAPGTWEFERLPVVPDAVQAEIDSAAATTTLLVPGATWGSLEEPGDADVFTFQGTAGAKLSLSVLARSAGSPLDPVLTVYNVDGKVLDTADDGGGGRFDPSLTFSPPADGEYRIEVSDRFGFGGERFFYVLTATPERPDFAVQLDQDAYVVRPSEPLEIKLSVARSGGMAEPVTLAVDAVPDGVTVTLVEPQPDESGAWVVPNGTNAATLKLEASDGTTYSGPVSIIGTSGDESQRRPATAPLVRVPLRTPHIWLTVAPKP